MRNKLLTVAIAGILLVLGSSLAQAEVIGRLAIDNKSNHKFALVYKFSCGTVTPIDLDPTSTKVVKNERKDCSLEQYVIFPEDGPANPNCRHFFDPPKSEFKYKVTVTNAVAGAYVVDCQFSEN